MSTSAFKTLDNDDDEACPTAQVWTTKAFSHLSALLLAVLGIFSHFLRPLPPGVVFSDTRVNRAKGNMESLS